MDLNKNKKPKRSKVERRYGDYMLLVGMRETKAFKLLFTNMDAALLYLLKDWLLFVRGMFNFAFTTVTRVNHGIGQCGFVIWIMSVAFFCSINTNQVYLAFKGVGSFYILTSPFWKDTAEIKTLLLTETNSKALLGFTILMCLTSLVHVIRVYLGFGSNDISSRGDSSLYILTKFLLKKFRVKRFKPNHQVFQSIVDPSVIFAFGLLSFYLNDPYFGTCCFLMGGSEVTIQVANKAETLKKQTLRSI